MRCLSEWAVRGDVYTFRCSGVASIKENQKQTAGYLVNKEVPSSAVAVTVTGGSSVSSGEGSGGGSSKKKSVSALIN